MWRWLLSATTVLAAVVTCSGADDTTPPGTTSAGPGAGGTTTSGGGGVATTTSSSGGGGAGGGFGGEGGGGAGGPFDCSPPQGMPGALHLVEVADLDDAPLLLTAPTGDATTAYIGSKGGVIRSLDLTTGDTAVFVDLTARIDSTATEQGLFGLAFHPDYATNGRYFVHYSDLNGNTTIAELSRDDPAFESIVVNANHPAKNHYGGSLEFDPDGELHVSLGDGNQNFQGQDPSTIFAAIVRLDIDGDTAPTVVHYGLRNPWRANFDPCTGDLYVGDVGEVDWEEINIAPAGSPMLNWGWDCFEGSAAFFDAPMTCPTGNETGPMVERENGVEACSIVGGYVYRGSDIPWLRGRYLYGDVCFARVWSFVYAGGQVTDPIELTDDLMSEALGPLVSFGRDGRGELYVIDLQGPIYRIEAEP